MVDEEEYIGLLAPNRGAMVVIHAPNTVPFPEDEGINLETGSAISIGIREVIIGTFIFSFLLKYACIHVFKILNRIAPEYPNATLQIYTLARNLRTTMTNYFQFGLSATMSTEKHFTVAPSKT